MTYRPRWAKRLGAWLIGYPVSIEWAPVSDDQPRFVTFRALLPFETSTEEPE